jgi:hypothetical protein
MINKKSDKQPMGIYSIPFISWLFGNYISYIKMFIKAFNGQYGMDQELDENLSDPISDSQKDIYNLLKEKEGKTIDIIEKRISRKDGAGEKVVMDKKTYVKEHKKLIKLLESAGKEGEAQKKELKKELEGTGKDDGYALHAIIIKKKGYNKNDAELEANKFKTEKGMFMRETKLSYRFRNIPKTKFEPKTYRTKKINKDISLIYGKLK